MDQNRRLQMAGNPAGGFVILEAVRFNEWRS